MTRKQEIETRLDASLRRQVPVPRLDARFNAAVWQRIAAAQAPAVARPARASRWLLASNLIGVGVSVVLIVYFVAREFTGVSVDVNLPLPEISAQANAAISEGLFWGITVLSVGFGFAFTRLGRRVRDICRSEFA
jgi:hypothetical protein